LARGLRHRYLAQAKGRTDWAATVAGGVDVMRDISELLNTIHCGDCLDLMREMPDKSVDLTVTSPPYDNLREYKGYSFKFEDTAKELFRITKDGGVVVWVVGDATINGSETGTSFKQALYFKDIGFNLHDTMIYEKLTPLPLNIESRYNQEFEYMFVLSKGKPKITNVIKVPTKNPNRKYRICRDNETSNGGGAVNTKDKTYICKATKNMGNIWGYVGVGGGGTEYNNHPADFPEQLANDHILSWSNEGDLILDPFNGSGTTCKMAKINQRNFIGIDISQEYCYIARKRLEKVNNHRLTDFWEQGWV
jgi:DNA modification methylase